VAVDAVEEVEVDAVEEVEVDAVEVDAVEEVEVDAVEEVEVDAVEEVEVDAVGVASVLVAVDPVLKNLLKNLTKLTRRREQNNLGCLVLRGWKKNL
jgi:hypothetical protein